MFWIFKYDLKSLVSRKVITILILALLIVFLIGLFAYTKIQDSKPSVADKIIIGVVDMDKSQYSNMILSFFDDNNVFKNYVDIIHEDDESILDSLIDTNEIDLYIVIPKNFVQSVIDIENVPVKVVLSQADITKSILIQNLLEAYEGYIEAVQINCVVIYDIMKKDMLSEGSIDTANLEVSLELVATAIDKNSFFNRINIDEIKSIPIVKYYSYVLLYLLILYAAMAYGLRIMKEQQSGILSRFHTTGMNPAKYFIGKQLFILTVFSTVFFAIYTIKFASTHSFHFKSYIFCIIVSALFSAFFLAFSSLFTTMKSYLLASNLFIIFSVILGGGIIPLLYLPQSMIKIARFSPNYWFVMQIYSLDSKEELIPFTQMIFGTGAVIFAFIIISCIIYIRKEEVLSDV